MRKIGISMCSCTPEFSYVVDSVKTTYKNLMFAASMDLRAAIECPCRGDRHGCEYYARRGEHRAHLICELWDDDYRTSHYRDYLNWERAVLDGRASLE